MDKVVSGECKRFMIHMPPQHGKSSTVTIPLPVYMWLKFPTAKICVTGHNQDFAETLSMKIRSFCEGIIPLNPKIASRRAWENAAGGRLVATGVGTPPTGQGFHMIIIDDPIKSYMQAASSKYQSDLDNWYNAELFTRLQPRGRLGIINTLWSPMDLAPKIYKANPSRWTRLIYPAFDEDGNTLFPERYSVEEYEEQKENFVRTDGMRLYEAVYQQNPSFSAGNLFPNGSVTIVDRESMPANLATAVRGWDFASTIKAKSDFTASVKLFGPDDEGNIYFEVIRFKKLIGERNAILLDMVGKDGEKVAQVIPKDAGSAGDEVAEQMKHRIQALGPIKVHIERPTGSKGQRLEGLAYLASQGKVKVIRSNSEYDAATAFIQELEDFNDDGRGHDDMADAAASAYNYRVRYVPSVGKRYRFINGYPT